MKNSIGNSVILTLAGESHGEMVCAVLDGFAPGVPVDEAFIARLLSLRRPSGPAETARREKDAFRIVSGVFEGRTTGAPITILIPNEDARSADYEPLRGIARPSHADYTAHVKYAGFEDPRGGGHFSGRITAGIVAAGAIALSALERKGIKVGTHIDSCCGISDTPFEDLDSAVLAAQIDKVNSRPFPVLADVQEAMEAGILAAKADGDSVGGVVQTAIAGLPAGVGEPWFGSLEGALSNALFSIGGIKGVEFGSGFALSNKKGSQAADELRSAGGSVRTLANHNGGINGGISNGMPVLLRAAVKPTPSIAKPLRTVGLLTGEETSVSATGRHDPAIVRRICIVVTSLVAIVLCDMLALRFGTDYLR